MPEITLDKIRGMIIGLAVGDALAAGYDNLYPKLNEYTGYIQETVSWLTRKGTYSLPPGTITDVTEVPLLTARMLLVNPQYPWQKSLAVSLYTQYANSGTLWLDKDMEAVFKGIKTEKGYNERYNKEEAPTFDPYKWSISNTSMHRGIPLSLILNNAYALEDCRLTHHHPLVFDTDVLYVTALRLALWDVDINSIISTIEDSSQHQTIKDVIQLARTPQLKPNISDKFKSDCFIPIYLLAKCAVDGITTFEDAMKYVIINYPKSDIRTNCGLIGAFYGAYLGYDALMLESTTSYNINKVRTTIDPNKDPNYTLVDFDNLCANIHIYYHGN